MLVLSSLLDVMNPALAEFIWHALMCLALLVAGGLALINLPWTDEEVEAVHQEVRGLGRPGLARQILSQQALSQQGLLRGAARIRVARR
jgi:hypothetical protein